MPTSRAVVVLGMHRSGTSALARGMQSLGVYLGDNFLDTRPDNPTGYWEDKTIVALNDRVLAAFGLHWEDVGLIRDSDWARPELVALRREALEYVRASLAQRPLWGFKDPRTIRVLPFWRHVFRDADIAASYLVAVRNPLSVAQSLLQRQAMPTIVAHRLWLVYVVPYLREVRDAKFAIIDYDEFLRAPRAQLERVAAMLELPHDQDRADAVSAYVESFVDTTLRHTRFSLYDFDASPGITPLTSHAYRWLFELAADRLGHDAPEFWSAWETLVGLVRTQIDRADASGCS
jgi:O-antigen biosynthesis protein